MMLELLKFVLTKLDFVAIAKFVRERNNRMAIARLHFLLVKAYEVIDLYRLLLDELRKALADHEGTEDKHRFFINPHKLEHLLGAQASNLEVMDALMFDLLNEIRILDNKFAEMFLNIFPGKWSILLEARMLLSEGRLFISEIPLESFPSDFDKMHLTLSVASGVPKEDQIESYIRADDGSSREIVEVNIRDADRFFRELNRYFTAHHPNEQLAEIESVVESYKQALLSNFRLEDVLTDIAKVRAYY